MFGLPALGGQCGSSNFKINDSVTDAIAKEPRAVLVTLEDEEFNVSSILEQQSSLEQDFEVLQKRLTEACIVLFRDDTRWNLLSWTPAGTGVKKRTMYASSHGQLKDLLPTKECKEYAMIDIEDVTAEAYREHFRVATKEERLKVMTMEEKTRMEVNEDIAKEQQSQPQRLAGLGSVKAPIADEWKKNLKSLAKGGYTIVKYQANILDGSFQSGLEKASDLKGKLTDPAYVLFQMDEKRVLFLLWTPDVTAKEARVKKMSLTSFKSNFLQELKYLLPEKDIVTAEAHDDDDLESVQTDKQDTEPAETKAAPAPAPKWKPPVGGFALPGMGAGAPPAGGFKLPGM